jgi:F-type H+-transporting ATPase subunit delta
MRQSQTLARRYATAVFELASEAQAVDAVGAELDKAAGIIFGDDEIRRFYLSPVFGRAEKEALLARAFEGKLSDIALHTLLLLVRKRREPLLQPLASEYRTLARQASGLEPLEVVSARELGPGELDAIVARLAKTYGKAFEVTARTDPSLLGGLRITMGDRRIDGTLSGRFDELSRELFARN